MGEPLRDFVALRDLLSMIYRRRILAAGVAAVTLALVAGVTFLMTPIYEATSTILIKFGRESVYRPEIGEREAFVSRDRETLLNSALQIVRSRDLMEDVIQSVGITNLYPELPSEPTGGPSALELASRTFAGAFAVSAVRDTDVIQVSFRHPDREMSARVVNLIVERFKEKHLEAYSEPRMINFLEEQVATYRGQLEDAENRIKGFEAQHPHFAVESPGELLLGSHEELGAMLADVEERIATFHQRQGQAQESPELSRAKSQLLDLQLKEKQLLGSYKETSRQVVNVREEIRLVREFLSEQENAVGREGFAEQRVLEERKADLQREIGRIDDEMRQLPLLGKLHRDLARERDSHERNYNVYLKKLEEARLSDAMDREKIANISVIQAGLVPAKPVSPHKQLNLALGAFLGVALGLLAAYLVESNRPTAS